GATGVSTDATVTASFSEAMKNTTITSSSFLLTGPGGNVATSLAYDANSFTAILTPSGPLAANATYTATVKGGAGGVTDLAGNALAQDLSWSFTTGATQTPLNIWGDSFTPVNSSDSDTSAMEAGVKFRSDVAGQILGIRFYKGSANTGTHVGS